MKKSLIIILLVAVSAGVLFAGASYTRVTEVVKNADGSGYAYGVLSHTKDSSDSTQYIQCQAVSYSSSTAVNTRCYARDAAGDYISGYTSDERYAKVIGSINKDTWVYFVVNSSGQITTLSMNNRSQDVR